jgi:hypothetical protein
MHRTAAGTDGVAALDRALAILAAFRPEDDQLSLADLAKRTSFYKSTILRSLATLERRRFVVRLTSGGYRLGPAVLHLGMVYQRSFRLEDHVLPVMRTVSKHTQESVSFYTHEGNTRVCLFRIDSPLSVRENHTRVGDVNPVTRGPRAGRSSRFATAPQAPSPPIWARSRSSTSVRSFRSSGLRSSPSSRSRAGSPAC